MEKLNSLEEYKWIRDETVYFLSDERPGSRVENFLPNRFDHYCSDLRLSHLQEKFWYLLQRKNLFFL
ncbi:hypothetical protein [Planococcus salinarum]|uniref:hypothetical protein n=1 Tax=Planococcus salinarum TaxID=622695 RepID=UPI000E3DAD13|nr:hypothetical protein [Planococcus salinarum]TAA72830.1 hypothetical protein D2909_04365 [Planococcus salinarum]